MDIFSIPVYERGCRKRKGTDMSEGMNDGRLREGRKSDGMEGREEGNATGGNEVGE